VIVAPGMGRMTVAVGGFGGAPGLVDMLPARALEKFALPIKLLMP
jgi:hypothetical protein